jgi:hypothetical protein
VRGRDATSGLFLCSNLQVTDRLLPVGATAVVRGVFRGLPWYEQAVRILESGASSVTAARWPGAATREISFYAQSLRTGDHALREAAREALARGDWELVNSAWRPDGWDTSDLALDLVVDPDGPRRWKDEDEYAHHVRLGLITDAEHAAVQTAREEAVALVEARGEMFAESARQRWLPDPVWATPSLAR